MVRNCQRCLQSSAPVVSQCGGIIASMNLLTTAVQLRECQQTEVVELLSMYAPTGSSILNDLLVTTQNYLIEQLSFMLSYLCSVESNRLTTKTSTTSPQQKEPLKPTSRRSLFDFRKRIVNHLVPQKEEPTTEVLSKATPPTYPAQAAGLACTQKNEWHQLLLLELALFLIEHFYANPNSVFVPLKIPNKVRHELTGSSDFAAAADKAVLVTMVVSTLYDWHALMLQDHPWFGYPPITINDDLSLLVNENTRGTTWELPVSLNVHSAWCKAMERVINSGRLPSYGIDALAAMLTTRLRGVKSSLLSLPLWSLFLTCIYKTTSTSVASKWQPHISNQWDVVSIHSTDSIDSKSSQAPTEPTPEVITMGAFAQEQLANVWERIRGNVLYLQGREGQSWQFSVDYSELRLLTRLMPNLSLDMMQWALLMAGLLPRQIKLDRSAHLVVDALVNKAFGEFARSDHKCPGLALSILNEFFGLFLAYPRCREQLANWLTLSLPTILARNDKKWIGIAHAVVVCLCASTHPDSELLFSTCLGLSQADREAFWDNAQGPRPVSSLENLMLQTLSSLTHCYKETHLPDGIFAADINSQTRRMLLSILRQHTENSELLSRINQLIERSMTKEDDHLHDPLASNTS
ncbi:Snail 2 [Cichlidogyrus casuarinus]|uniref:Snail 2 n=1 Tax=Cichlidogyrus casuarinus TaxID=1844966 RepID=A0ABD2Q5L0_9PLAT